MNVLLIEDDIFQAKMISNTLEQQSNAKVSITHSGEEALKLIAKTEFTPELVVCDLSMPGIDGIEVLYHFAQINPNTCFAILSAANDDILQSALNTAHAYGMNNLATFSKPLSSDEANKMLAMQAQSTKTISKPSTDTVKFTKNAFLYAFEHNQFELYYQPQVNVKDKRLSGAEALVRWNHPELGVLTPYHFLSELLSYGLGAELTEWLLENASADICYFKKQGINTSVSVNVNASDISNRGFTNELFELVDKYSISPSSLIIEVTEHEFSSDAAAMLETLTRLRLAGFEVSIDDFGTGYSSFYQLTTAPFNELKIDRSFVQQLLVSEKHYKSIKAICSLCNELGIKTVIEGVESDEEYSVLQNIGADKIQGYYFSKPMSKFNFVDWSKDR